MNLRGSSWNDIRLKPHAAGVFLVVIDAGSRFLFSTASVVLSSQTGPMSFVGCINDMSFNEALDPLSATDVSANSSFSATIPDDLVDICVLRRAITMQTAKVEVRWAVLGVNMAWEDALLLAQGTLRQPVYDEESRSFSFAVNDELLDSQGSFPPLTMTADTVKFPDLQEGDVGKVYPILFGTCLKVPMVYIGTNGGNSEFLVCGDPFSLMVGGEVTDIWDGDTKLAPGTIVAQTMESDIDGARYLKLTVLGLGWNESGLTADVTGYDLNLGEVIRYLVACYPQRRDAIEFNGFDECDRRFSLTKIGVIINGRSDVNAFRFVSDRFGAQFPFVLVRMGGRYIFRPLRWWEPPRLVLHTRLNIVRCSEQPIELSNDEIYSQFIIKWGQDGIVGAAGGGDCVVERETDAACMLAEERYGKRLMGQRQAQDCGNEHTLGIIRRWLSDTHTTARVRVSYECTLDVLTLDLLDNVRVYDINQGWAHGPLFKVIGITLGTAATVLLDLISVDRLDIVHDVDRAEEPLSASHPSDDVGDTSGWGDGLPGGTVGVPPAGSGMPDF